MSDVGNDFDLVIVGGGIGGLCCAGEALLHGLKPLLICETKEVAYNLRSVWLGKNRFPQQTATIHFMSSEAGWWAGLARDLNVPLGQLTEPMKISVALAGTGDKTIHELGGQYLTAASLTTALQSFLPMPSDELRAEFEQLMHAAFCMPYQQLLKMDSVPVVKWIEDQGAGEFGKALFLKLVCLCLWLPSEAIDQVSTFGALGGMRMFFSADAILPEPRPDMREGIFIPMAETIEERGGVIWRGRKVARISTEGGDARTVVLEDGTEVTAPIIAIATSNTRARTLLDPVPAEVLALVDSAYSEQNMRCYYTFSVFDKPVLPEDFRSWFAIFDMERDWFQLIAPEHARAPWDTEPGKQTIYGAVVLPASRAEELGGADVIYKLLREQQEEYFPGMQDALCDSRDEERVGGLWYSQTLLGQKLPRRSPGVDGLFYVGDGSPVAALWTEGPASAGILGARDIAAQLGRSRRLLS